MADDFDVNTASLGLGSWSSGAGVGKAALSSRQSSYDERLQEMRKHLRLQQEKQKRNDARKKVREQEMSQKWVEYRNEAKEKLARELREQMAIYHTRTAPQQPGRKIADENASPRGRENGGSLGGGGGYTSSHCAKDPASPSGRDSLNSFASPVAPEDSRQSLTAGSVRTSTLASAGATVVQATSNLPNPAASGSQEPKARQGGYAATRVRKKKREEAAAPLQKSHATGGREKSIMQQAQEQFQGLCRSSDGRAILDHGTRRQRMHREALIRGDPEAGKKVEEAEKEAEEKSGDGDEHEVEEQVQTVTIDKFMVRKYRLRMMREITSQVLHCRKKITNTMKNSFLSPSGLGCSLDNLATSSYMSADTLNEDSTSTVRY